MLLQGLAHVCCCCSACAPSASCCCSCSRAASMSVKLGRASGCCCQQASISRHKPSGQLAGHFRRSFCTSSQRQVGRVGDSVLAGLVTAALQLGACTDLVHSAALRGNLNKVGAPQNITAFVLFNMTMYVCCMQHGQQVHQQLVVSQALSAGTTPPL